MTGWTGAGANREWYRGSAPPPQATAPEQITWHVRRYLTDCRRHRTILAPKYHPTADGAVKVIYHRTAAEADAIRAEFDLQTTAPGGAQ